MKKQRENSTDSDDPGSVTIPPRLSSRLERRLASYAIAAGAAGVGMLALAPASKADVIYTRGGGPILGMFDLDVNGDQRLDFTFSAQPGSSPHTNHSYGVRFEADRVKAWYSGGVLLGPLPSGYRVGGGAPWQTGVTLRGWIYKHYPAGHHPSRVEFSYGPWAGHSIGALGLKFTIDGQVHYGYARIINLGGLGGLAIEGYAYETVPNRPILTTLPEPGTLGLLALGSLGIAAWRRKKPVTSDR